MDNDNLDFWNFSDNKHHWIWSKELNPKLSKEQLYENVWGNEDIFNASNLTSFIRKLRKKIEPVPDKPRYIITVWGVGYKFNEEKP